MAGFSVLLPLLRERPATDRQHGPIPRHASLIHRFIHHRKTRWQECWKKNDLARNAEPGVMIQNTTTCYLRRMRADRCGLRRTTDRGDCARRAAGGSPSAVRLLAACWTGARTRQSCWSFDSAGDACTAWPSRSSKAARSPRAIDAGRRVCVRRPAHSCRSSRTGKLCIDLLPGSRSACVSRKCCRRSAFGKVRREATARAADGGHDQRRACDPRRALNPDPARRARRGSRRTSAFRPSLAPGRYRQRQDRGLPRPPLARNRCGQAGALAGAGDQSDTAARAAHRGSLARHPHRRAAQPARGSRAQDALAGGRRGEKYSFWSERAWPCSRRCHAWA